MLPEVRILSSPERKEMSIVDIIGDKLGYKRCEGCGRTMWQREHGSWLLYTGNLLTEHCNRCAPPPESGRLYRVDCNTNSLVPINEEAYVFELQRAGKPGAPYQRIEDVPKPVGFHESFGMRGQ